MKHIAGWFRRNNTIMAQAKDLQRQWQEMRDENRVLKLLSDSQANSLELIKLSHTSITDQLHRVARERDNERKLRLEAESRRKDREHLIGVWADLSARWENLFHRMTAERDAAEDRLLDYHLDKREKDEEGRAADRGWFADVENEEE